MLKSELSKLLPLIMRERDYIEIPASLVELFASIEDADSLVHLENSPNTINWKSEILPDCRTGYSRLWSRQDWEITDNVRRKAKETSERLRQADIARADLIASKRAAIMKHFVKTGLTTEIVNLVIFGKDCNEEKISTIFDGLKLSLTVQPTN